MITYRYAQERAGQKLHIVPVFGEHVALESLCGRHVTHWRMDINVPMGHCCQNCARINRSKTSARRHLRILRDLLDRLEAGLS